MRLLITIISERRVQLFILVAILSLVLGFFTISPGQALQVMIYGGYWIMLLVSGLFAWTLYKMFRTDWGGWDQIRRAPRWPAVMIAVCGCVLLVHEAYGFKILMDEVMLLGTSMSLHFDKMALVPMRGHDIQGAFQVLGGDLDKRPLFHPFLVSLIHDIFGYRPENVFALNTVLTFFLLTLSYCTGFRLGGKGGGAIAVLLLTSIPLMAQNATGGGFEILNLVMILGTLLLGMRYAQRRDGDSLDAFGLSAILLAQTRYESVLFLFPVAFTILWVWWSERKPNFTWLVVAMPFFLVPCVLHNKIFSARTSSWEMASQPGFDRPFSFSYIADNIGHDLNFFFSTTGSQSNSLVLSCLGFLALPFLALWTVKVLADLKNAPPIKAVMAIFSLGFAAHALLMLCYFWGRFDDPVIRRLSLPFHLTLMLATIITAMELDRRGRIWLVLAAVVGIGFFAQSIPTMSRHSYTSEYYYGREMEWRRQFIAEHPEKDYLFIDNSSIIWITHLVSATTIQQAREHKENIIFNQRNRTFSAIYVFQRYAVEPDTGALTLRDKNNRFDDDLGPDYKLETVWERRFTPLTVSRISRVVSIHEGPSLPPETAPANLEKMSPDEREKIRQAYLENFIKRLP